MQDEKESRPAETDTLEKQQTQKEPLSEQEIAKEARRIMACLPYAYPKNQTADGQIPVRVSPQFMDRAELPMMDRLREQIPVEGARFGTMKGRTGFYLMFPADEAKAAVAEQPRLTYDEVHRAVYDKMAFELADYKAWLLSQPPEEILNHASGFVLREDIVFGMGESSLTRRQTEALLRSPSPLSDVCRSFEKMQSGRMVEVMDCIEDTAERAVDRENEQAGNEKSDQTRPAEDSRQQREAEAGAVTAETRKPSVLQMLQDMPDTPAATKPPTPHKGRDQAR